MRCENANRHRTEKLWRMCAVRKSKQAPHRKAAENVCGAGKQIGTAQKSCGRNVRCVRQKMHRTGGSRWKCTVTKKNLICEEENCENTGALQHIAVIMVSMYIARYDSGIISLNMMPL